MFHCVIIDSVIALNALNILNVATTKRFTTFIFSLFCFPRLQRTVDRNQDENEKYRNNPEKTGNVCIILIELI